MPKQFALRELMTKRLALIKKYKVAINNCTENDWSDSSMVDADIIWFQIEDLSKKIKEEDGKTK